MTFKYRRKSSYRAVRIFLGALFPLCSLCAALILHQSANSLLQASTLEQFNDQRNLLFAKVGIMILVSLIARFPRVYMNGEDGWQTYWGVVGMSITLWGSLGWLSMGGLTYYFSYLAYKSWTNPLPDLRPNSLLFVAAAIICFTITIALIHAWHRSVKELKDFKSNI